MNRYVLVAWPESQRLMDKDWFKECILVPDEYLNDWIWTSSYFVPEDRYLENDFDIACSLIFCID